MQAAMVASTWAWYEASVCASVGSRTRGASSGLQVVPNAVASAAITSASTPSGDGWDVCVGDMGPLWPSTGPDPMVAGLYPALDANRSAAHLHARPHGNTVTGA